MNKKLTALMIVPVFILCWVVHSLFVATQQSKQDFDKPLEEYSKTEIQNLKKELSEEEIKLLLAYEIRQIFASSFGGERKFDGTFEDAIENQREFSINRQRQRKEEEKEEEQDRLKAQELEEIQDDRQAELSKIYKFKVVSKEIVEHDYTDYVEMEIDISNYGDVGIRAMEYSLDISTLFGDYIRTLTFRQENPINARRKITARYNFRYNKFIAKDKELGAMVFKNHKLEFRINKVLLQDGTRIDLQEGRN